MMGYEKMEHEKSAAFRIFWDQCGLIRRVGYAMERGRDFDLIGKLDCEVYRYLKSVHATENIHADHLPILRSVAGYLVWRLSDDCE